MSHDRGCFCGRETYEYWDCDRPNCDRNSLDLMKLSTPIKPTQDKVVNDVMRRLILRSAQGMKTYGVSMADNPLSDIEWIDHTIEELLDAACYLERLKSEIKV